MRIDFRRAEVFRNGAAVPVSAMEFKIIAYFIENRGALLTRDELLDKVWGYDAMPVTRTVDVHVGSLRQKLERNPAHPEHILTVHRRGYRLPLTRRGFTPLQDLLFCTWTGARLHDLDRDRQKGVAGER